jgi:hypothetical protein
MEEQCEKESLNDAYKFPGFSCSRVVKGVFGDRQATVVSLNRRLKKTVRGTFATFSAAVYRCRFFRPLLIAILLFKNTRIVGYLIRSNVRFPEKHYKVNVNSLLN